MNTREDILARVRHLAPSARPLPELPDWARPAEPRPGSFEAFAEALQRMGGRLAAPPADGDVDALIARLYPDARHICSATPEVKGSRRIDAALSPQALDDVDVGVVRARLGVAETGSVLLTERELGVEALGFLSQHLVVLLDPAAIVESLHDAYLSDVFRSRRYAIFMTGPSATADIEGVLIHGAQGIRSLSLVPLAV